MNEREFAELAAGYALNALSASDLELFESTLAAHPEWSKIVDEDAATVAALGEDVADVAPPLTLRSSLLSQITTLPQGADAPPASKSHSSSAHTVGIEHVNELAPADTASVASPGDDPAPTTNAVQAVARRNWTRGLFALAASLVLLVVLGFGAANLQQWMNRPPAVVALNEIEEAPDGQSATIAIDGDGVATAHWSGSLGKAVLVTDGLPTIPEDETFEMWFVRGDGSAVSAGTFDAQASETTTLLEGEIEAGDIIAVTVEQAGGSQTGAPTTTPIIAIPTV